MLVHHGDTHSGHFVTYRRSPASFSSPQWLWVSDDSVRKASLQEVLSSSAYLLFYERVHKWTRTPDLGCRSTENWVLILEQTCSWSTQQSSTWNSECVGWIKQSLQNAPSSKRAHGEVMMIFTLLLIEYKNKVLQIFECYSRWSSQYTCLVMQLSKQPIAQIHFKSLKCKCNNYGCKEWLLFTLAVLSTQISLKIVKSEKFSFWNAPTSPTMPKTLRSHSPSVLMLNINWRSQPVFDGLFLLLPCNDWIGWKRDLSWRMPPWIKPFSLNLNTKISFPLSPPPPHSPPKYLKDQYWSWNI